MQIKYWEANGITLTQREVYSNDVFKGYSYTLGVVPLHENVPNIDYCKEQYHGFERYQVNLNVFGLLTLAELENDIDHYSASIPKVDYEDYQDYDILGRLHYLIRNKLGWGGRKTVGGSSWNTPSKLSPQQIIDKVLNIPF